MIVFTVATVLRQLVSLFLMIAAGYLLGRMKLINEAVNKGLSVLITRLAMPSLIIIGLQEAFSAQLLSDLGLLLIGMIVATAAGVLPCLVAGILLKRNRRELGLWLCCAGFANSVFMGRPIIEGLYGTDLDFQIASIMFSFSVLVFTVGTILMNISDKKRPAGFGRTLFKLIISPAIVATLFGFVLFLTSFRLPAPINYSLSLMSGLVTPLAMLMIGYALSQTRFKEIFTDWRVYVISFFRLLVCPILTLLLLRHLIRDPVLLGVLIIAVAMPVASIVGVLSEQADNHPSLCSKTIFLSTILSVVTTPAIALIMTALPPV